MFTTIANCATIVRSSFICYRWYCPFFYFSHTPLLSLSGHKKQLTFSPSSFSQRAGFPFLLCHPTFIFFLLPFAFTLSASVLLLCGVVSPFLPLPLSILLLQFREALEAVPSLAVSVDSYHSECQFEICGCRQREVVTNSESRTLSIMSWRDLSRGTGLGELKQVGSLLVSPKSLVCLLLALPQFLVHSYAFLLQSFAHCLFMRLHNHGLCLVVCAMK